MKNSLSPWKTNLEPGTTNLEPWKTIKTDLGPWKSNLRLEKLSKTTWNYEKPIRTVKDHENQPGVVQGGCGWLQVVTGDSQEEVIISRDKQTDRCFIIIYISSSSSLSQRRPTAGKAKDGMVGPEYILGEYIFTFSQRLHICLLRHFARIGYCCQIFEDFSKTVDWKSINALR